MIFCVLCRFYPKAVGAKIRIPTVDGDAELDVPAGTPQEGVHPTQ